MAKLKATVREEFERLAREGVTEAELKRARDSYLDQRNLSRSQDTSLAALLGRLMYTGRAVAYEAELDAKVRALTVAQVSDAAKKYLDVAHLLTVGAGDFGKGGK